MKIKRLKQIRINSYLFHIKWDNKDRGASFSYRNRTLIIGTQDLDDFDIYMMLSHEIWEICCIEMHVRLERPDCESDYIFVYDHRQFETLNNMYCGVMKKFGV